MFPTNGGGIGHAFGGQINAGKTLEGLTVVECVFESFVSQPIPLLEKIDPQIRSRSMGGGPRSPLG